jgi:hypothetical protein
VVVSLAHDDREGGCLMGHSARWWRLLVVLVGLLFVATGCATTSEPDRSQSAHPQTASFPADVTALAAHYGLRVVSESTSLSVRLPRNIEASSQWGLKQHVCLRAGYDLQSYAGQPVELVAYQLSQRVDGKPLALWIVRTGNKLVGAYVTDQVSAPGVYAVNEL